MTSSHLRISPCGHQCPPVRVYQAKGASEPPVSPNLVPRWAGGTSEPGDTHGCNCAIQTLLGPQGQASEGAPSLTDPGGPVRIHYLLRGVGNQSLVLHVHLFLSALGKISKGRVCVLSHFSRVRLCVTLWTVAHQVPLSSGILQARIQAWVALEDPSWSSLKCTDHNHHQSHFICMFRLQVHSFNKNASLC